LFFKLPQTKFTDHILSTLYLPVKIWSRSNDFIAAIETTG